MQPFGPLTSVGLKELFLKTTVLLAFASAKHIKHLHAFSVDSDCIRFGPGDCSVTLRPRLEYVPKSLSTPFERTETFSPSALATKSSPSQSADAQTAICPVRALRFYIDRSSSFRQSIQLLGAMVGVQRAEAYRNKVCHTGLWTLSRRHIQPKVWKCPLHIRGRSTRAIVPPSVVKMYVYSRYLLGSQWSSQNTFARFYKLDVQSLASQVRSVSN